MALLCRTFSRQLLRNGGQGVTWSYGMSTSAKAAEGMEEYWKKNERLKRPLSPHLTIYRPQMTSMLSIMNRFTGIVLTAPFVIGPLVYMAGSGDFTDFLQQVQNISMGSSLIQLTKLSLAFSFSFHFANGIRHLAWDNAMGFKLDTVTKTGYMVMALTAIFTVALMML